MNLCASLKQQLTCCHLKSTRLAAHRTKLLSQNGRLRSLLESSQQKVEEFMANAERRGRREAEEAARAKEKEMGKVAKGLREELKA